MRWSTFVRTQGHLVLAGLSLVLGAVTIGPSSAPREAVAPHGGRLVVYNLYVTDGQWALADGSRVDVTGLIGGRADEPLTFVDRNGQVATLEAGPPSPTSGPVREAEAALVGQAQPLPPILWATTEDVIEIRLKHLGAKNPNVPSTPQTIGFPIHPGPVFAELNPVGSGAAESDDVVAALETSAPAVPATAAEPGAGNVLVYLLRPTQPGTYVYAGVDPSHALHSFAAGAENTAPSDPAVTTVPRQAQPGQSPSGTSGSSPSSAGTSGEGAKMVGAMAACPMACPPGCPMARSGTCPMMGMMPGSAGRMSGAASIPAARPEVRSALVGPLVVYAPDEPAARSGPGRSSGTLAGCRYDRDLIWLVGEPDSGMTGLVTPAGSMAGMSGMGSGEAATALLLNGARSPAGPALARGGVDWGRVFPGYAAPNWREAVRPGATLARIVNAAGATVSVAVDNQAAAAVASSSTGDLCLTAGPSALANLGVVRSPDGTAR